MYKSTEDTTNCQTVLVEPLIVITDVSDSPHQPPCDVHVYGVYRVYINCIQQYTHLHLWLTTKFYLFLIIKELTFCMIAKYHIYIYIYIYKIYNIIYMIWYDMIWYDTIYMIYLIWHDIYDIWYETIYMKYMIYMIRYDIYDVIWYDMMWYMIWYTI